MKLALTEGEPTISVGLMTDRKQADFGLKGEFADEIGLRLAPGDYRAVAEGGRLRIFDSSGRLQAEGAKFLISPQNDSSSFIIRSVTIGIDFHWQREQDQEFQGSLEIVLDDKNRLIVVNRISVEAYLASVISSEMSAESNPELLKAHSIISRSWLLAQIKPWKKDRKKKTFTESFDGEIKQLIRWYDQEAHAGFDVCADDHCQRYQGITKATSAAVFEAVRATYGKALTFEGELCDARFSKSCGGMTESFHAAWDDLKFRYLAVSYDGETFPREYSLPLTNERNAERWICNSPPAFCNTSDRSVLNKILPDFDQETRDFYRWQAIIPQQELQELLKRKLGVDFGSIISLDPIERGESGRIIRLKIAGERETLIIGKELEIRRALSASHLYSSAFVVKADQGGKGAPSRFRLIGAGWGHGVGLCQIGAALMAERGYNFEKILEHYYKGATLRSVYKSDH